MYIFPDKIVLEDYLYRKRINKRVLPKINSIITEMILLLCEIAREVGFYESGLFRSFFTMTTQTTSPPTFSNRGLY
jgi:hypothetical protein